MASWLFSWLSLSTSWSCLFFSIFAAFQSSISLLLFSLLSLFFSYCFLPLCFSFLFLVEPTSHSAIVRTHAPVFFFVLPPSLLMKQVTVVETFIPYTTTLTAVRAIISCTVALNLEHFDHAFVQMSAWCKGNALPMANLHTVTSGEHTTLRPI